MHLVGLFIPCVFPHPDGVILISVAKFVIREHEKISVFAAMTVQVATLSYVQIMTPKDAQTLSTADVSWANNSCADYVELFSEVQCLNWYAYKMIMELSLVLSNFLFYA